MKRFWSVLFFFYCAIFALLIAAGGITAGSNAITLSGSWVNNGAFTANTSTVTLDGTSQTLTIPNHDELDKGTLKAIYNQALRYISEENLKGHFYTK